MVKFLDIDPNEIDDLRATTRGRVSYPLLKTFLETGKYAVIVDRTGMQQSLQGLMQSIRSYVRNHNLPIKPIIRRGQLVLLRLDINKDGTPNPYWDGGDPKGKDAEDEEVSINAEEVAKRFEEERHKGTK